MSAATFLRGTSSGNSGASATSTTSIDVTVPAGTVAGDEVSVAIALRTSPTAWRAPAGWTLVANPTLGTGSFYVYRAKYGTDISGAGPWTFDDGASNTTANRWEWHCIALTGVGAYDTATSAARASSSTDVVVSITTAANRILVGHVGDRASGSTWTWSATWIEEVDNVGATGTNAASTSGAIYDTTPAPAGTYSFTATATTATANGAGAILAYAAAAAASFSGSLAVAGSGSVAFGGTPRTPGSLTVGGTGTVAFGGKPIASGPATVSGSGSLSLGTNLTKSGSLTVAGSGALTLGGRPKENGGRYRAGTGDLTLSGVRVRVKYWDGSSWVPAAAVKYWDGAAWQDATVKVWDGATWS